MENGHYPCFHDGLNPIHPGPHFTVQAFRGTVVQVKRFLPFLAGNRSCIGMELAKLNYTTAVASLLSRFSFRLSEDVSALRASSVLGDIIFLTEAAQFHSWLLTAVQKLCTPWSNSHICMTFFRKFTPHSHTLPSRTHVDADGWRSRSARNRGVLCHNPAEGAPQHVCRAALKHFQETRDASVLGSKFCRITEPEWSRQASRAVTASEKLESGSEQQLCTGTSGSPPDICCAVLKDALLPAMVVPVHSRMLGKCF
jgi:hypothetical protein